MTTFMRFRGFLLAGTACLLALAAGDAQADPIVAQRLFLEATTLTAQANSETDPTRRAQLFERAQHDLQAIVTLHGDTALAAQLNRGEAIGTFDPRRFNRDLAAARSAVGTTAPQQAQTAPAPNTAKAAPAPAAGATAQRTRLPTAPVDPKSLAGTVLADVVGALEKAMAGETVSTITVAKPITATQSGETVTVTFPGLRLVTDAVSDLVLGDIRLDGPPQPGNRCAFRLPLPSEIIGTTKGQPAERLTMVAEPITGVWAPGAGSLLRLYVRMRDLKLEQVAPEPRMMLRVASLLIEQKGELQANRLSGDMSLEMRDTVANDTSSTQQVRIGRLAFSSQALDFDMEAWRRLSEAMQGNGDSAQASLDFMSAGRWAKVGTSMAMDDFEMTEDGKPLASMGGFHLGFELDARPQAGAAMSVKLGMERMQATQTPVGDLPPGMMPHSFAIDTTLEPIPLQAMAQSAQTSLQALPQPQPTDLDQESDQNEDQEQDQVDVPDTVSLEDQWLGVIMTAQPTLNVTQASLASDLVQLSLAGAVTVDPTSPVMSRGTFSLKIAGLDQIKAYVDDMAKTDKSMKSYGSVLTALRRLGTDGQLNGLKAKEFHLTTTKAGAVTINGTPWEKLLQNDEPPKNTATPREKKRTY